MSIDLSQWPYPIAFPYQQMLAERDPRLALRKLIKTYAAFLKYVTIVSFADYMHKGADDEKVSDLIGRQLERPSLGHWAGWIRVMRNWGQNRDDLVLSPVFNIQNSKYNKQIAALIDKFITLRNEHVHADWLPEPQESQKFIDQYQPLFGKLLDNFALLKNKRLLRNEQAGVQVCHGPSLEQFTTLENAPATVFDEKDFLFVEYDENRVIPLPSLLMWHEGPEQDGVYVYETLAGNKSSYFNANYRIIVKGLPVEKTKNLIKSLKARKKETTGPVYMRQQLSITLPVLRERAAQNYEEMQKNGFISGYRPRLYVERAKADRQLREFVKQNERNILLVLARSGAGKTNLLSNYAYVNYSAVRANSEGDSKDIVFIGCCRHVPATNIDSYLGRLIGCQQNFSEVVASLDPLFREYGGKLTIILDAINEHTAPLPLWNAFVEMIQGIRHPWLRFIISSRPMAWEKISSRMHAEDMALLYRVSGESGITLDDFSEEEFQQAYEAYASFYDMATPLADLDAETTRFLHDPLIMRLTFEAFQGAEGQEGKIPSDNRIQAILQAYIKRKLRDRDQTFLQRLVEGMWFLAKDHLFLEDLSKDELRISPNDEQQGGQSLGDILQEYIYDDPVYEFQRIFRCTNAACSSYIKPEKLSEEEQNSGQCPQCGLFSLISIAEDKGDLRTPYDRCLDENVIETVLIEGEESELRISFVYDRIFEYILAKYLQDKAEKSGSARISFLSEAVEKASNNSQLWYAVRTAVESQLVGGTIKPYEFPIVASESLRSMVTQALVNIGRSDEKRVRELLPTGTIKDATLSRAAKRIAVRVAADLGLADIVYIGILYKDPKVRDETLLSLVNLWQYDANIAYDLLHKLVGDFNIFLRPMRTLNAIKSFMTGAIILALEINLIFDKTTRDQGLARIGQEMRYCIRRIFGKKSGGLGWKGKIILPILRNQAIKMLLSSRTSHDQNYYEEYSASFRRMTEKERQMMRDCSALLYEVDDPEQYLDKFVHCATQDYIIRTDIFFNVYTARFPQKTLRLIQKYNERILCIVPMSPIIHMQIGQVNFYIARMLWADYLAGRSNDRTLFDDYFATFTKALREYLIVNHCRIKSGIVELQPGDKKGKGGGWFMVGHSVLYHQAYGSLENCDLLPEYCQLLQKESLFALDHVECMHRSLSLGGAREQLKMLLIVLENVSLDCIAPRDAKGEGKEYKRLLEFFARVRRNHGEELKEFFHTAVERNLLDKKVVAQSEQIEVPEKLGDLISQRSNAFFSDQIRDKDSFFQTILEDIMGDVSRQHSLEDAFEVSLKKMLQRWL